MLVGCFRCFHRPQKSVRRERILKSCLIYFLQEQPLVDTFLLVKFCKHTQGLLNTSTAYRGKGNFVAAASSWCVVRLSAGILPGVKGLHVSFADSAAAFPIDPFRTIVVRD